MKESKKKTALLHAEGDSLCCVKVGLRGKPGMVLGPEGTIARTC